MTPEFRVSGRIGQAGCRGFRRRRESEKAHRLFHHHPRRHRAVGPGTTVTWWGDVPVEVDEVEADTRIVLRSDGTAADGNPATRPASRCSSSRWRTAAPWSPSPRPAGARTRRASKRSYRNCEGWSQMLSCMKAYLEHGINLREGYYPSELKGEPAREHNI